MKRTIKFRGRRSDNGELVYGNGIYQDLPVTEKQKELGFVSRTYIIGTEFPLVAKLWHPVDPESVAQLVGFDRDGNEVYEGDIVEYTSSRPGDRASQRTKTAPIGLCPQIYADDTDHNKPMRRFKLKEA